MGRFNTFILVELHSKRTAKNGEWITTISLRRGDTGIQFWHKSLMASVLTKCLEDKTLRLNVAESAQSKEGATE